MKKTAFAFIFAVILILEMVFAVYMLPSSSRMKKTDDIVMRNIEISAFDDKVNNIASDTLSDIYDIPKAYVLPLVDAEMPKPNENGYSVVKDSSLQTWDNTDVLRYEDETTKVTVWKEFYRRGGVHIVINYAEIEIAHPTQLKRHLAGWEYGSKRKPAGSLSKEVNAVVAVSGDFYNYRRTGIIVQNGVIYRDAPSETVPDILFVNSEGDFLIETCENGFDTQAYVTENEIMFSMAFGPTLIKDGHVQTRAEAVAYKGEGGIAYINPRVAVGQLGPLHYLFCTVDGRNGISNGITTHELAEILAKKGCVTAYNLDGGGSTTMVFRNEVYNSTANNGQRHIADILYIATAKPE